MIGIIDYGMGNLCSVKNALEYIGIDVGIVSKPEELAKMDKMILPGVGSFYRAMDNLKKANLTAVVKELIQEKKIPVLGICLGMQLLSKFGEEDGGVEGLGVIDAEVLKFQIDESLPVPHIGFNSVHTIKTDSKLFNGIEDGADFYFVHSYRIKSENQDFASGITNYGECFISAFEKDNVFGTQFHPEKSQSNGLIVLKNFAEI